jgi:dTDP-4-amino-4,6-dideoxygalactose transaminase
MDKYLIQQPLLVKSTKLKYYLNKVDKNRYYSNFGPLYFECKKKIEKHFNFKKNKIIFTSSGHNSLLSCCCLIKKLSPKKKYILVPSYSFNSNPLSILQAGFEPIFLDISRSNLCLDDKQIIEAFKKYKKDIAAVMFVSPFGYPISLDYLNNVQKRFKTKVIYDAADTFLNLDKKKLDNSELLITCSFHPTKTLPGNESGMIITPKKNINYFNSIINFGFKSLKVKKVVNIGFNGKFSEYDAAIFMANFDHINKLKYQIKKNLKYITEGARRGVGAYSKFINFQPLFSQTWISLKLLIMTNNEFNFQKLAKKIKSNYKIIIYKAWSPVPMHDNPFFKKFKKSVLANTNYIKDRIFFIPFNVDYKKKEINRIVQLLKNFSSL